MFWHRAVTHVLRSDKRADRSDSDNDRPLDLIPALGPMALKSMGRTIEYLAGIDIDRQADLIPAAVSMALNIMGHSIESSRALDPEARHE